LSSRQQYNQKQVDLTIFLGYIDMNRNERSHVMTTFAQALECALSDHIAVTANGMPTNATTGSAVLNCFFVIGSSRGKDISEQFRAALQENPMLAIKALFWARDVRGGAGERDTFRKLLTVLEQYDSQLTQQLMPLIPEYGRYDDLHVFNTDLAKNLAIQIHANAIRSGNGLASKWAQRKGPIANQLRKALGMDPKTYRKTVVGFTKVVETQMCAQQWDTINYSHVPSVASARYQKSFTRHDPVRYAEFKASALKGDVKINSSVLFPYDVLRSIDNGDPSAALAQWQNLPNYLGDNSMILPIIDTSGSMSSKVGNSKSNLTCMDVAISLGLYLADKQTGAFKDMFLNFDNDSKIHNLKGNLLEKIEQIRHCKWGGTTNLDSALKEILRVAVMGNVPQHEMPQYLLVISDMGFNPSTTNASDTAWQMAKSKFDLHGYKMPVVVWWNVSYCDGGYGGDNNFPVTQHENGTCLVSGFSPSIVKSILGSKKITPYDIMLETLDNPRYDLVGNAVDHYLQSKL
jgi:hypothetical protein